MWGLTVNKCDGETLTQQLFRQLCSRIMEGVLPAGEHLPPSRQLAQYLGISRNVVLEAYEQLRMEGFIDSRPGAWLCVAAGAVLEPVRPLFSALKEAEILNPIAPSGNIDFNYSLPALREFPRSQWARAWRQALTEVLPDDLAYTHPQGSPALRTVLARYLRGSRGIVCSPDQIVITAGSAQAYALAASLWKNPPPVAAMEDPGNREIRHFLTGQLGALQSIRMDDDGIQTDQLTAFDPVPQLIFVTPCHQFPTGGLLPIQRRIQLIEYARYHNSFIVEDDYDSEFVFGGAPAMPLQVLDGGRVLYVGSFSKILAPGLRLGYLILPGELCRLFRELIYYGTFQPPVLDQQALANFIGSGALQRHLAKMKKLYRRRRQSLTEALERHFPGRHRLIGSAAGLHATVEFPQLIFSDEVMNAIARQGVNVYRVEDHAGQKGRYASQIILGYGNLSKGEICAGVERLALATAPYITAGGV